MLVVDRGIEFAFVDGAAEQELETAPHIGVPVGERRGDCGVIGCTVGERHPDEHDQRLTRVYLTAVGHKLETELRAVSAAQINETIGSLPEGDRRELGRLLEALSASISAAIDARQRPSA